MSVIPLPKTGIQSVTHTSHSLFPGTILTGLADSELTKLKSDESRRFRNQTPNGPTKRAQHLTKSVEIRNYNQRLNSLILSINLRIRDIP